VPKRNGKLHICVNFHKLNVTTKKDLFPLPFIDEIFNIVARHEAYLLLDGFSKYHKISIAPKIYI
jgi:hypothetical protein